MRGGKRKEDRMMKRNQFTTDQVDPGGRVGIPTFLKAPISKDLENVEVGIIGIPFDGACIDSPGTRYGPRSVRNMSWAVTDYNLALNINPFEKHKIADCGDVLLNPWSITKASESINEAVTTLLTKNILPVSVGGDHFITYPILKAISQCHGPVAVVHFDSHLDTADVLHGERYHNASVFRRGIEEGFIIPDKLLSVGIRRIFSDKALSFHQNHNSRVITNVELKEIGSREI